MAGTREGKHCHPPTAELLGCNSLSPIAAKIGGLQNAYCSPKQDHYVQNTNALGNERGSLSACHVKTSGLVQNSGSPWGAHTVKACPEHDGLLGLHCGSPMHHKVGTRVQLGAGAKRGTHSAKKGSGLGFGTLPPMRAHASRYASQLRPAYRHPLSGACVVGRPAARGIGTQPPGGTCVGHGWIYLPAGLQPLLSQAQPSPALTEPLGQYFVA